MDSLPVSMVPLKKRAWKPNDNQIDLNIRNRLYIISNDSSARIQLTGVIRNVKTFQIKKISKIRYFIAVFRFERFYTRQSL